MSFARTTLVLLLSTFTLGVAGCGSSDSGGGTADNDTGVPDDTGSPADVARDTRPADTGAVDTATSDTATADTATGDTGTSDTGSADTGAADVDTDTGVAETSGETGATTWEVKVGGTGFVFTPATLAIKVGDTVHWTWAGSSHSVTSGAACVADGKFDSAVLLSGATFSHTFDTAGAFPYFCSVHCAAGMVGTVTVTP